MLGVHRTTGECISVQPRRRQQKYRRVRWREFNRSDCLMRALANRCERPSSRYLLGVIQVVAFSCRRRLSIASEWRGECLVLSSGRPFLLQLYHIGGWNGSSALRNVSRYDETMKQWQPAPPFPQPRAFHRCTVLDCRGLVCAGVTTNNVRSLRGFYR